MSKKTTFYPTIKNYWNIRMKHDLTGEINIRKIINYVLVISLITLGIVYGGIHSENITTMLSAFMITVAIFTAALFVASFNTIQIYREVQEKIELYLTAERIVIDKLRTIIDYGISMGFITVIFLGVNIIFDVNNAPLWVIFSSLTITGLLVAYFLTTMLKTVRLVRVVKRIMLL